MTLAITKISETYYAVDDGQGPVSLCPCCGSPFDRPAAEAFVRRMSEPVPPLTMDKARAASAFWQAVSAKPNGR